MEGFYLDNFRSFEKQEIQFSRINILIGENNSGKSSLLKFLLMLKQTMVFPKRMSLNLREKNGDVDLGTYFEIISNHETTKKIEFGFKFGDSYVDYFLKFMTSHNKSSEVKAKEKDKLTKKLGKATSEKTFVKYQISKNLGSDKGIRIKFSNKSLGSLTIKPNSDIDEIEPGYFSTCDIIYTSKIRKNTFVLKNVEYTRNGFNLIITAGSLQDKCEEFKIADKKLDFFVEIAFLIVTQNFVDSKVKDIIYINPVNSVPNRVYLETSEMGLFPVSDIDDVVNILTDESIGLKLREKLHAELNQLLCRMGIAKEIQIVKSENGVAIELRVRVDENNVWCNIKDVGYGVPLQIPLLFQALLSEKISKRPQTIVIEQPEIHIYPKLHAKFIETLLSIGKRNIYKIETHSEHLIRKLQLIVKQKQFDITSKEITINYFKKTEGKTIISNHLILEDGTLDPPLPRDFFDTSYNLIKDLMF